MIMAWPCLTHFLQVLVCDLVYISQPRSARRLVASSTRQPLFPSRLFGSHRRLKFLKLRQAPPAHFRAGIRPSCKFLRIINSSRIGCGGIHNAYIHIYIYVYTCYIYVYMYTCTYVDMCLCVYDMRDFRPWRLATDPEHSRFMISSSRVNRPTRRASGGLVVATWCPRQRAVKG